LLDISIDPSIDPICASSFLSLSLRLPERSGERSRRIAVEKKGRERERERLFSEGSIDRSDVSDFDLDPTFPDYVSE